MRKRNRPKKLIFSGTAKKFGIEEVRARWTHKEKFNEISLDGFFRKKIKPYKRRYRNVVDRHKVKPLTRRVPVNIPHAPKKKKT